MSAVRRYRTRPVEVEAVQFDGTNHAELADFMGWTEPIGDDAPRIFIHTPEGTMQVSPGDWVIRGVAGEFYRCEPDVFDQSHELVPCPHTDVHADDDSGGWSRCRACGELVVGPVGER